MGCKPVEGGSYESGNACIRSSAREDFGTSIRNQAEEEGYRSKLDSIARQREAEGSTEGAGEGETGERCGGKKDVGAASVGGIWDLVS